jgi:hypothetical protein
MKIALLCAMAFVTLSSLPFASHQDHAMAQQTPAVHASAIAAIAATPVKQIPVHKLQDKAGTQLPKVSTALGPGSAASKSAR